MPADFASISVASLFPVSGSEGLCECRPSPAPGAGIESAPERRFPRRLLWVLHNARPASVRLTHSPHQPQKETPRQSETREFHAAGTHVERLGSSQASPLV